jgi:hypothetical protein
LEVSYADLVLRLLKADSGGVPVAGSSRARQLFYHQLSLFGEPVDVLRLLVLWDADGAGLIGDLMLVCPKRGAETRESIEVHWTIGIPHPAEDDVAAASNLGTASSGGDGALYRLPTHEKHGEQR